MPVSLILLLAARSELPKDQLGREAQGWFLKQVLAFDPLLSAALHNKPQPAANVHPEAETLPAVESPDGEGDHNRSLLRPYTISDLYALSQPEPGERGLYALRITAYRDELETLLTGPLAAYLARQRPRLKLWYGELEVQQVLVQGEHPWAGRESYGELVLAGQRRRSARITLDFITPTAFRSEGADIPLPIPKHIFRACWQKWNLYAPPALLMEDSLFEFVEDCLLVQSLTGINTTTITFAGGKRGGATGFTGRVGLVLNRKRRDSKWQASWEHHCAMLHTLARFAFYSGCGHHTTIGLGQTIPME